MINDKQWWEELFGTGTWESNNGKIQTEYFAQLMIDNLPTEVKCCLSIPDATILDWGCALGQAANLLLNTFPLLKVTGLDFSEKAIEYARRLYPEINFRTAALDTKFDYYDVIFTSNVLEHFSNPMDYIKDHLICTKKYYIALVPYNQAGHEGPMSDGCHIYSFTEESFPYSLGGGQFTKCWAKIIPPVQLQLWCENQLLVIYERRQ